MNNKNEVNNDIHECEKDIGDTKKFQDMQLRKEMEIQATPEWHKAVFGDNPYESIDIYSNFMVENPNLTFLYNNRGIAFMRIKEYEKAIQDFKKGLELNKYSSDFLKNLARAYAYLEDYDTSLNYLQSAIQSRSSDYFLLGLQAEILLKARRVDEGLVAIKEFLLQSKPQNEAHDRAYSGFLQAFASFYRDDEQAAREFLTKAFDNNIDFAKHYRNWVEFQNMDIDLKTKIVTIIREVQKLEEEKSK